MLSEIERNAIDAHRERAPREDLARQLSRLSDPDDRAILFALRLLLEGGQLVRESRGGRLSSDVHFKADGSPATEVEERIEAILRDSLPGLDPEIKVVGEETGGELPDVGSAIAIDPIDGTRAFLAETETYSTTLALIRQGKPELGMVSNPATGEIAYATAGGDSRMLRLSLYGEPDEAYTLRPAQNGRPLLVNVHPSRRAGAVVTALYRAWQNREISMVRSPGGSPAWELVEAARGHFVYLNLWSKRPAQPRSASAAMKRCRFQPSARGAMKKISARRSAKRQRSPSRR